MAIFGTPDEKETKKSERQKEREAYVQEENDQKRIGQRWQDIQVSTGPINVNHDILTVVFAKSVRPRIKSDPEAYLETVGFENLLQELQKKA